MRSSQSHQCNLIFLPLLKKSAVLLSTIFIASSAYANPVLDNIAHGNVSVSQTPTTTTVNQGSPKAILNWHSFNIGAGEHTHFQQPVDGVALNRINPGQGASEIYGHLSATGKIILINQAGVYFGPGSFVDVGGIIASTSDMSDENFLAGKYVFDKPSPYAGSIVNEGTIRAADHGLVALVGTGVDNRGNIEARMGTVALASGNKFTMDMRGDGLINFVVDEPASQAGVDHKGNKLRHGVSNTGAIYADAGRITVSARAARGVVDNVINMEGVAQAKSVYAKNGEIILSGGEEGVVRVAGKLSTSGREVGARGGKIHITGKHILVTETARIKAKGRSGGGEILIGGNYQGKGPLPNAKAVVVQKGAKIRADAIKKGNGGRIIVYADDVTKAYGTFSARGGSEGGNGGLIETSGKNYLDVNGILVDTSAPFGVTGTWFLDPTNIFIANSIPGGADSSVDSSGPATFTASGAVNDSYLLVSTLLSALASNDVTVSTTNAGNPLGTGNITLVDPLSWTSTRTLTLLAADNIILNAGISAVNGGLTLDAGTLSTITTSSSGSIAVRNFILSNGIWSQNSDPLPSFSATNNFQINGTSQFLRVLGGLGTSGSPYQITDIYGLQGIKSLTLSNSYTLANSLNASGTSTWNSNAGFVPIGTDASPFTGTFNGAGNTISNLTINQNLTDVGLFGVVRGSSASVSNLILSNASVSTSQSNVHVGTIIGKLDAGTLSNSSATGTLTASDATTNAVDYIGGLVGFMLNNPATISGSSSAVTVNSTGATVNTFGRNVGGIVGYAEGDSTSNHVFISNSSNTGTVSSATTGNNANNFGVGGLAGQALFATISGSYNSGNVTGGTTQIGGIAGLFDASTLSTSYNNGTITENGTGSVEVGGLIGRAGQVNSGTKSIDSSFNTGLIIINTASNQVGGIVGQWKNGGAISNVYNTGAISNSSANFKGGIVGVLENSSPTLTNVFNVGHISSTGGGTTGGLVGTYVASTPAYSNAFFNTTTTGQTNATGNVLALNPIGTSGKTTSEMMTQSTFTGYNFSGTWGIINATSYPYLTSIFSSTPRVVSGTIGSATGGKNVSLAISGTVANGALRQGTTATGADGSYYFLEGNGVISSSAPLAIFTSSGDSANIFALAPTSNGSFTGLNGAANTITVQSASGDTISNSDLALVNGLSGVLFSASGNNLTLTSGINFITSSNPIYNLNGNLTASGSGSLTFGGAVNLGGGSVLTTSNQPVSFSTTVNGAQSLQIASGSGAVNFGGAIGTTSAPTALSSTGSGTVTFSGAVGSGSSRLGSVAITGLTNLNSGSVYTSGAQTYSSALTSPVTTILDSSGGPITYTSIDVNSNSLTLAGSTITLANPINNLTSLLVTTSGATNLNMDISTPGSQTYNGPVVLNANRSLSTTSNGNLSLLGGVSGPSYSLTLSGDASNNIFTIQGGVSLAGLNINGGAGTNTLALQTNASSQNWNIGVNAGTVTGTGASSLTFSNIQNLTGNAGYNTYHFSPGSTISGLINGGSVIANNTLNYASYGSPIMVTLTDIDKGSVSSGGTSLNSFSSIGTVSGTGSSTDTLSLPNKRNFLNINSSGAGFLNDPLFFSGFYTFNLNGTTDVIVNGTTLFTFTGSTSASNTSKNFSIDGSSYSFNGSGIYSSNNAEVAFELFPDLLQGLNSLVPATNGDTKADTSSDSNNLSGSEGEFISASAQIASNTIQTIEQNEIALDNILNDLKIDTRCT